MPFQALPVITDALTVSGLVAFGEAPEPEAAELAARLVNDILLEWSLKSIYNPGIYQFDIAANGTSEFTLGPGGDSTNNPRQILQVVAKQGPSIVWPLTLRSFADWDAVAPKNIAGVPQCAFWDSQLDSSTLIIWPIPPGGYTIGVTGTPGIPEIKNSQSEIQLPVEYREFLKWTLVMRLVPMLPPDASANPKVFEYIERNMNTAGSAIKRRNSKMRTQSIVLAAPGTGGNGHQNDGYIYSPARAV
jgi:hypothetical protein